MGLEYALGLFDERQRGEEEGKQPRDGHEVLVLDGPCDGLLGDLGEGDRVGWEVREGERR